MANTEKKDAKGQEISPKYSFVESAYGVSEDRFKELCRSLIKSNVSQKPEETRDSLMKKILAEAKTEGEKLAISNYEGFVHAMNSNPFFNGVDILTEIGFTKEEIDELEVISENTAKEHESATKS